MEVGLDAGGEDAGAHPKDLGQVLLVDAFGVEEGDYGADGVESRGVEIRVLGEGFACIDSHDFKAEDLLFELEGEFGVGGCVERMLVEQAFGFCSQLGVQIRRR